MRATLWASLALAFVAGYSLATLVVPPRGLHAKYYSNDNWREWLVRYFRAGYVRMPIVLAIALLGLVSYAADATRRNSVGLLLALTIGYLTLVPAILAWPQDRYRLPVDALIFMFAAWGIRALVAEADRARLR